MHYYITLDVHANILNWNCTFRWLGLDFFLELYFVVVELVSMLMNLCRWTFLIIQFAILLAIFVHNLRPGDQNVLKIP